MSSWLRNLQGDFLLDRNRDAGLGAGHRVGRFSPGLASPEPSTVKPFPHLLLQLLQLLIQLWRRRLHIRHVHNTVTVNLILRIVTAARAATPTGRRHPLPLPMLPQGAAKEASGDLIDDEHEQISNGAGNATADDSALGGGFPDDLAGEASTALEEGFLAGLTTKTDVPGHGRKTMDGTILGWNRKKEGKAKNRALREEKSEGRNLGSHGMDEETKKGWEMNKRTGKKMRGERGICRCGDRLFPNIASYARKTPCWLLPAFR